MLSTNALLFALFYSIIAVTEQQNCSTYDPCGKYGYCRDDSDNQWTCECKFWWNGKLCNQQTESGKEVIALGCLLAVLLISFYGLAIAQCIRNRKQEPKETPKKVEVPDPTFIDIAFKTARDSARLSSLIITIFMIIVTIAALLSKWALIQPIHNEIVYKYQTNQPLYYIQNNFCNIINLQDFNVITFPVACFLIILFIIQTKRTSLCRDKCYGYGGPPIPVDFLSHIDRKFAAVVFAMLASELLSIMEQAFGGNSNKASDGVIVFYLLRILEVIIMGFRYYPILAAVYIDSIFTLACATIYAWLDYAVTVVDLGMCEPDFYSTYDDYLLNDNSSSTEDYFKYYGTGQKLIAIEVCIYIPVFVCLAYVSVKLPALLITKIYNRVKKNMTPEEKILHTLTREQRTFFHINRPDSIEMLYVRNLFRRPDQRPPSQSIFARLLPKKMYEWRDDFRFSTRVLCVYAVIFMLLYFVTIQAFVIILPQLLGFQNILQQALDAITSIFIPIPSGNVDNATDISVADTSNFPVPSLVRPYLFAVFFTFIIIIIQLLVLLVNIRRNLFQSFRGDDVEIPRRVPSRYVPLAVGNIHFAGYFIGYLIWGFIMIAVLVAIICISIEAFITFGSVRFIEKILKAIIPTILFIVFKQYLNKFLAQYVFLQHCGEVLSLNNRRILMIFIYFNVFLDAFLGFVSAIFRLILSVIGGIIYMCRLDYSPLGRKLETIDGGFNSYCGFIHTECVHRHPVMLLVVSHLYTQMKMKQWTMEKMDFGDLKPIKQSSRYIRKWKLAVFLMRNPTFVFYRKAFLNQLYINEMETSNHIDNHDKKNIQQRLSAYTRRISAARSNISVNTSGEHIIMERL